MITTDIINQTYIQRIVDRDAKIIHQTQKDVVDSSLQKRTGALSSSLENFHYHIEGTHFQFKTLSYLRFLDIKYRNNKKMKSQRGDIALYNRVIWGVLYNETMPALRYGLSEDIRTRIRMQLEAALNIQQSIPFEN